jgi:hypothetical protein
MKAFLSITFFVEQIIKQNKTNLLSSEGGGEDCEVIMSEAPKTQAVTNLLSLLISRK